MIGLQVPLPDVVAMPTRQPNLEGAGEIPVRRLVKGALRMRPSWLVVGEVRQETSHGPNARLARGVRSVIAA